MALNIEERKERKKRKQKKNNCKGIKEQEKRKSMVLGSVKVDNELELKGLGC